jgi:hypothetical protein
MFNLIWSAIKTPKKIITGFIIGIIITIIIILLFNIFTLKKNYNDQLLQNEKLVQNNRNLKMQLDATKEILEYHERNTELASYAREQTIINNNHYHKDTEHTREIIREFKESEKTNEDYNILIKQYNNKFGDI